MKAITKVLLGGSLTLFIAVFGYGWHLRDVYLGFNASTDAGDAFFPRDTLENYGEQILDELKRKDVKFAVISRAGQAREKLPEGVMFTHSAFFRRNAAGGYDIYNLYHGVENRNRSSLVVDTPADFLRTLQEKDAGILIPDAATQDRLHAFLETPEYSAMHHPDYSLISNPFDLRWQNCNEFMLYVFGAAIWNTTERETLRKKLEKTVTPTELKVSFLKRYYGPKVDERLILKDHGDKVYTTTFATLSQLFEKTNRLEDSYVIQLKD